MLLLFNRIGAAKTCSPTSPTKKRRRTWRPTEEDDTDTIAKRCSSCDTYVTSLYRSRSASSASVTMATRVLHCSGGSFIHVATALFAPPSDVSNSTLPSLSALHVFLTRSKKIIGIFRFVQRVENAGVEKKSTLVDTWKSPVCGCPRETFH